MKIRHKPVKRSQGRPTATQPGVGRDALIDAARVLLQELPPAQVTSTAIARRAEADPALVRYYFGNRANLLLEVAKQIGAEANRPPPDAGNAMELLVDFIHSTFRFTRSAKHMQRLMIEEIDTTSSSEMRKRAREWNQQPVGYYAQLQKLDGADQLIDFNPLFMHIAVVGMSDFFVSGAPLIELLVPEGTDMKKLGQQYEEFVAQLVLKGLEKRYPRSATQRLR
jgi:AcrR family transcriptional regulator